MVNTGNCEEPKEMLGNNTRPTDFLRATEVWGGVVLLIKAQPAGRLSLPGPSAVLVKQLKTGSCHAE